MIAFIVSYDEFRGDRKTIAACTQNISQIGELTTHLDSEYMKQHSDVPWRKIYGIRNRIVHDYKGIKIDLVWEIIQDELPDLKKKLLAILEE